MLTNILKTLHITQTNIFYSIAFTVINKYGESGVRQISTVFGSLTVLKGPLKRESLDIYFTTYFRVRNFLNTSAMRVIFLL